MRDGATARYGCRMRTYRPEEHAAIGRLSSIRRPIVRQIRTRTQARGRRVRRGQTCARRRDMRHGQRWRERPRLRGSGATPGQDTGVVHAIAGSLDCDPPVGGRQTAPPPCPLAPTCCTRQRLTRSRSWRTRGEGRVVRRSKLGGQPGGFFAWPPSWRRVAADRARQLQVLSGQRSGSRIRPNRARGRPSVWSMAASTRDVTQASPRSIQAGELAGPCSAGTPCHVLVGRVADVSAWSLPLAEVGLRSLLTLGSSGVQSSSRSAAL